MDRPRVTHREASSDMLLASSLVEKCDMNVENCHINASFERSRDSFLGTGVSTHDRNKVGGIEQNGKFSEFEIRCGQRTEVGCVHPEMKAQPSEG